MTQQTQNCPECGAFLPAAPSNRHGGRKRQFCSDACSKRARRRAAAEPVTPTASSGHRAQALEVIMAVKLLRGAEWTELEEAESGQLLSLATAVDADSSNIAGLRELRVTLAQFRKGAFRPDEGE